MMSFMNIQRHANPNYKNLTAHSNEDPTQPKIINKKITRIQAIFPFKLKAFLPPHLNCKVLYNRICVMSLGPNQMPYKQKGLNTCSLMMIIRITN